MMSQSPGGVNEVRGTAPVWKRALTTSLGALSGLMHSRYQSTFETRDGARPKAHHSLWSSFTSGLSAVGHFVTSLPSRIGRGVRAFVKNPIGAVVGAAKAVGNAIVAAGKAIGSAARSIFDFVIKTAAAVWNSVFKAISNIIAQFTQHENAEAKQIAQADRAAQRRYEKQHAQKVYEDRQLARTVEIARQAEHNAKIG